MKSVIVFASAMCLSWAADPGVEVFEKFVRPVLSGQCETCHSAKQKQALAGLRVDSREALLRGGKSGAAIVPGDPDASLLIRVLERQAGVPAMPPAGALPAETVRRVREWITAGAPYPIESAASKASGTWWSLRAIARPGVPAAGEGWARTPVDRFVAARHRDKGLTPSAEADRRTLIRRLSFDLTGLPPTMAEVRACVEDKGDDAYDRLVERLLDSPRYGERWARHWMDVAHFAETDGYESDMMRANAWPYRDYLIRAFNEDKRWSRFIEEQVAGDVLYPSDRWALIATGFLAAGPWDSNTIPPFSPDRPDVLRAYALDRDDMVQTVMASFNSMTVHCARCHDHKFDPIPQKDHYALQAVFAGVDRANRPYDEDAAVHEKRQRLIRERLALDRRDAGAMARLREPARMADAAVWWKEAAARVPVWTVAAVGKVVSKGGVQFQVLPDHSLLASGPEPESDTMTVTLAGVKGPVTALRLEFPTHESLPLGGPGRSSMASFVISEVRVKVARGAEVEQVCVGRALADYEDAGAKAVALTDQRNDTTWRNYPRHGEYRQVVIPLEQALEVKDGESMVVEIDQRGVQMIGRVRFSITTAQLPERMALLPPLEDQLERARYAWIRKIDAELAAMPEPRMVFAATNHFTPSGWFAPVLFPRPVEVLERGEVEKPRGAVGAGALSAVAGLASRFQLENANDEGQRRAALARWLASRDNPLTWRSIANRVWHYHFGRGIVDTPNDFGRMGSQPTHPELLEWLAAEFRDSGGSLKRLHRLIVKSATYRQTSNANPEYVKADVDNRYLWRMNRVRLDAESLRDAVIAAAGRLDLTMGGPSVKQAVVGKGVASAPAPDYAAFDWDSAGAGRRSVYRYTFRTLADPFMDALNCPNASIMTASRVQSVDPLQALVLLNNPFMTRHAEHLASQAGADPVRELYRRVFLREPTEAEIAEGEHYIRQHGAANFARVLLNANEFMFVN